MASATTTRRPLRADDLFNLTFIGDVAISPDGWTICYVQTRMDRETNEYQSDLWTIHSNGVVGDATRFTHEARTVGQPRWSPDGRWLAFLSDRDGKGKRQIWVIPTTDIGGEARRLTSGDTAVSDYAWAPDSARLAFVRGEKLMPLPPAEEPTGRVTDDVLTITRIRNKADGRGFIYDRRNHLWTVTLDGVETRLTEGDHDNISPTWSPDSSAIAFISKRMADADFTNATELYIVADTGGEARRLPTPDGPVDAPAWSPDGAHIAFTGNGQANIAGKVSQLWVIPADGSGAALSLTPTLDLNIGLDVSSDSRAGLSGTRPVWSSESGALFFLASTRGMTPLWRVALDGGEPCRVVDGMRQVQSFAFSADGGTFVLNLADGVNPGDLYTGTETGSEPRRLTDANGAFFATVEFVAPEAFTYEGAEGWGVQGWLMPPVGRSENERYPCVLEIHGGPHTAYGDMFTFEFQLLAAQGHGVLFINPRGSTGYGESFTMASNDDWGGNDYRDLMLGVDAAIDRAPWIDPQRLGVTGGSFGGYMTNWIVTQTDRFKAAVTQRSICNMVSKWGVSDIGYLGNDLQWGGPPWENLQFYLDRSPLTHVKNVVTPLLIIHSERDLRCPIEQGEQFFTALKYLRREVEMVRFPDEGHELSRSGQPLHRLERLQRLTGWFRDHL
ncbi:MAG: prolyl oligopeptidase family serine peptidase [Thermomicrobiales bacterium]